MANSKTQKRKYVIGLFVLLAMATVSTYAWSVDETLTTDPTKVYVTSNPATGTTISGYSSKPLGKNNITIAFTTAVASAELVFEFIDSSGNIINTAGVTVTMDGTTVLSEGTDYTFTATSVAVGAHYIHVYGTGCYKDLDSATGGNQTFNGLMIVVK